MKKLYFLAMMLCAGFAFTSCDEEPLIDPRSTVDFEGDYWNGKIDDKQYEGTMLYGDGTYAWEDETTKLSSKLTNSYGDGMFWGGGIAISNYIDENYAEHKTYDYQLSVPKSNGSKNFAVAYCEASVSFSDGKAREILSMEICPTTYLLGVEFYGDGYAKALTEQGDYLTLIIKADNGNTIKYDLARNGNIKQNWETISLNTLGEVKSLTFTMEGSDASSYGVKTPTYFAFDNIVIKK